MSSGEGNLMATNNFISFEKPFTDELDKNGVIHEYQEIGQFIDPKLFMNPDGIHGVLHAKRVLLITLIQSYLLKLPQEHKLILAWCGVFHDIGRENDNEDSHHGRLSMQKLNDKKLSANLSERLGTEGMNILRYIIENHAVSDKVGIKDVSNYGIKDVELAKRLYSLFKDADGLDRCRLGDLDVKYLRNEISMRLVLLAEQLLIRIK
jgi:hypothetical protein